MSHLIACWWQILLAAFAYFVIGALWFNPKVFGTLWMKSHNLPAPTEEGRKGLPKLLAISYALTVLICAALCYVLGATTECCDASMVHSSTLFFHGIKVALLLGCCVAGSSIAIAYTYQMKPLAAYLTDIGYHIIGCLAAVVVFHFTCACC